eukprot:10931914-Karenia_brevis.AAC.1
MQELYKEYQKENPQNNGSEGSTARSLAGSDQDDAGVKAEIQRGLLAMLGKPTKELAPFDLGQELSVQGLIQLYPPE